MLSSGPIHFRQLAIAAAAVSLSACSEQSNGLNAALPVTQPPLQLGGSSDIDFFYVRGSRLVGADAGNGNVEIYAYPKGGSPIQTVSGFSEPLGVTVVGSKGR